MLSRGAVVPQAVPCAVRRCCVIPPTWVKLRQTNAGSHQAPEDAPALSRVHTREHCNVATERVLTVKG